MIYMQVDMTMLVNMFFLFFVLFCSQEELENGYVWSTKMQYIILTGVLEKFFLQNILV